MKLLSARSRTAGGFTIVEFLLVIMVLSLITGLAVVSFRTTYSGFLFQKATSDLVSMMRYAQSAAITRGRIYRLEFDQDFSSYQLTVQSDESSAGNKEFELFKGRLARPVRVAEYVRIESPLKVIHFYTDGTIEHVGIQLTAAEKSVIVSTSLQKGAVRVLETEMSAGHEQ